MKIERQLLACMLVVTMYTQGVCSVSEHSSEIDRIGTLVRRVASSDDFPQGQFPDAAVEGSLRHINEYQQLRALLPTVRSHPRTWWNSVIHTQDNLVVLLHAMEEVSADAYIELGHAALSDLPGDEPTKHVFVIAYLMPATRKRWLFTSNYESPKVRGLLSEFRKYFAHDQNVVQWIDDTLSGKLAARDAKLRNESPTLRYQIIDRPSDVLAGKQSGLPSSVPQLPSSGRSLESKSALATEELTLSTPWAIIVAMIVVPTGLLLLVLKRRAK